LFFLCFFERLWGWRFSENKPRKAQTQKIKRSGVPTHSSRWVNRLNLLYLYEQPNNPYIFHFIEKFHFFVKPVIRLFATLVIIIKAFKHMLLYNIHWTHWREITELKKSCKRV
jgi:hypothetical protein